MLCALAGGMSESKNFRLPEKFARVAQIFTDINAKSAKKIPNWAGLKPALFA
jgi:hypothetical protein